MKTKICAAGDIILTKPLPQGYDTTVVGEKISQADLKLFNLEIVLSDNPVFGSAYCGGTWLMTQTAQLDDILRFGFNGCGRANNHTMDYAYDGLFSTQSALAERNLPACGAGQNLEEASRHAVVETNTARFGLISICSTFDDAARAGHESESVPGRPGLNPLRFSTEYHISPAHMQALREIAAVTHIDGRRNRSRAGGYTPYPPEGCFGFGEYRFKASKPEGKFSKANANDIARTQKSIEYVLRDCDYAVVMVHSHEIKGDTDDTPDDFLTEFAHACIDAGACTVIGSGTHQLKGIELYRGKPIFYSIGNFIFQSDSPSVMPADFAERYGCPKGLSVEEQIARRTKNGTIGLHTDMNNFRSIMPMMTFCDNELTEMELNPLSLDMETGLPMPADEADATYIYDTLSRLSAPYKTQLIRENNRIFWRDK